MTKLKDSGIPWIGKIPEHWKNCRFKDFLSLKSNVSSENKIGLENIEPESGKFIETDSKFDGMGTHFLPNNILYGKLRPYLKKVWIAEFEGSAVGDFYVFGCKKFVYPPYIKYLLLSEGFTQVVLGSVYGSKMPRVASEFILNLPFFVPPLAEQEEIAAYLDKKCGEIDELIEVEQQMISDLESYRQSVITEAVTHGLNSDVEMREPGIDWVANFPAHWNIIRFKSIFSTRKGLNITKADLTESGVPVISYGQIHSKQNCGTKVVHDIIKYVPETFLQSDRNALVKQGNFIFADTSEDIAGCGNCAYIDYEGQIFAGYHSIIASRSIKENNKYFAYLFLTDCWRSQIRRKVTGIKVFSVSQAMLSDTLLIVPPLSEQKEIADYLDAKCTEIDELIKVKQEKIETLKQYRQSLIFEAVTGKMEIE